MPGPDGAGSTAVRSTMTVVLFQPSAFAAGVTNPVTSGGTESGAGTTATQDPIDVAPSTEVVVPGGHAVAATAATWLT